MHKLSIRALRFIFPEKPFNPALIRITDCNQTGCECMVCTSNPSLMKGLSCPEIGLYTCNVCAWKALRHRTCNLFTATGVLPSRQNYCNCFFRGLRPRLLSLRSVVPSRHKRCIYINLFQDKTQPYICDGFEVQTIHSQPV